MLLTIDRREKEEWEEFLHTTFYYPGDIRLGINKHMGIWKCGELTYREQLIEDVSNDIIFKGRP